MIEKKLKILHVIPNLRKGGAERICLDICHELIRLGHSVKLVILENEIEYDNLSKGIEIIYIPAKPFLRANKKATSNIDGLIKVVTSFQPDVVHTHLFFAEFTWKCAQIRSPTLFHIHSNIPIFQPLKGERNLKGKLIDFIEKRKYLSLDNVNPSNLLCISTGTFNYIRKLFPNKVDSTFLIHNAINFETFYCSDLKKLEKIKLVSIGSLVKKKGHDFLIDVCVEIINTTSRVVEFIILGDGPERSQLEQKIKELKLHENIELVGKVDNPESFLQESNIYIHGAYSEPFGLVLIEAMAAGLPVFSTDGGGNRDIVINEKNGYLYSNRDPKLMANDILKLIEDEKKYRDFSNFAQEFAKNYDIKQYTQKLIETYISMR